MRKKDLYQTAPAAGDVFAGRETELRRFRELLAAPAGHPVPAVLCWYGLGGVGKTALGKRFLELLRDEHPEVPFARWDFTDGRGREQLLTGLARRFEQWALLVDAMRTLEREPGGSLLLGGRPAAALGLRFPHFQLAVSVLSHRRGGHEEPQPEAPVVFRALWEAVTTSMPIETIGEEVYGTMTKVWPGVRTFFERHGGMAELQQLRHMETDEILADLGRRLALDLDQSLPRRAEHAVRGVAILDTYELLTAGITDVDVAQRRLLERWLHGDLIPYLHAAGVLVVVFGRDQLGWIDDGFAPGDLDQRRLDGLSRAEAAESLARRGFPNADQVLGGLASIQPTGSARGIHPLLLELCSEASSGGPTAAGAEGIDWEQAVRLLADRVLTSLPAEEGWQEWVLALSLPRWFDRDSALAIRTALGYDEGAQPWRRLIRFSFLEPAGDEADEAGRWRLHAMTRAAFRAAVRPAARAAVFEALRCHHEQRSESPTDRHAAEAWIAWVALAPEAAVSAWRARVEEAVDRLEVGVAVRLLAFVDDPDLDARLPTGPGRGRCELELGRGILAVPHVDPAEQARWAMARFRHGLAADPTAPAEVRAALQTMLGEAYLETLDEDPGAALTAAEAALNAARDLLPPAADPELAARILNNLGRCAFLRSGHRRPAELSTAQGHFEAALALTDRAAQPRLWGRLKCNQGIVLFSRAERGDGTGFEAALECFQSALDCFPADRASDLRAWVLTNLGLAQARLVARRGAGSATAALESLTAALAHYGEHEVPRRWAATMLNLAEAHLVAADAVADGDHLAAAEACLTACLRVFDETRTPEQWAEVRHEQGLLRRRQGEPAAARECFAAALRVRERVTAPLDAAATHEALAELLAETEPETAAEHRARAAALADGAA